MVDTQPEPESARLSIKAGHELSDTNTKRITWFGIALVLGAIATHLGLFALFSEWRHSFHSDSNYNKSKTTAPQLLLRQGPPPQPRLQVNPAKDLHAYFEREKQFLSSYGWVDRKEKVVRIPIERAMELLLERPRALSRQIPLNQKDRSKSE